MVKRILLIAVLTVLAGCAGLGTEPPDVLLSDIKVLPSQGMEPRFQLGLRLINPNDRELAVTGGSFKLYLQGARVASGVFNQPVDIAAFSDALIHVEGSGDLLGGVVLFHKLMRENPQQIDYRLLLRLSRQGSLLPLNLERQGSLDLTQ